MESRGVNLIDLQNKRRSRREWCPTCQVEASAPCLSISSEAGVSEGNSGVIKVAELELLMPITETVSDTLIPYAFTSRRNPAVIKSLKAKIALERPFSYQKSKATMPEELSGVMCGVREIVRPNSEAFPE